MKFVPLLETQPEQVANVWNDWMPARYQVDSELLERLVWRHPLLEPERSFAAVQNGQVVGSVATKVSPHGRLYGDGPNETRHVCFVVGDAAGVLLEAVARNGGPLTFGQDHGHFFPGCPKDCPDLASALESGGFERGEGTSVDVEADLAGFNVPVEAREALASQAAAVRPCLPSDVPDLNRFFKAEFPGRWRYDTLHEISSEQGVESGVQVLVVDGQIEGFALTQLAGHTAYPIAGCVWHRSMGDHWCGLGPIGVSKSVRGTGLGGALLCLALERLKTQGGRSCAIDWTTLTGFYGKYGFRVSREYVPYTRK